MWQIVWTMNSFNTFSIKLYFKVYKVQRIMNLDGGKCGQINIWIN